MKITEVKKKLTEAGMLDDRQLFCYSTLAGVINGSSFQNLVGIMFAKNELHLFGANIDGSLKDLIITVPYSEITHFTMNNRFLYANISFSYGIHNFRFYNYDKKIMKQGFQAAGFH